jgi:hypothetical protein
MRRSTSRRRTSPTAALSDDDGDVHGRLMLTVPDWVSRGVQPLLSSLKRRAAQGKGGGAGTALFLAGLAAATGTRILRYPRAFAADIQSHSRGVGFFTTVAATAVFGTELVLQMEAARIAAVFWIAAAALWLSLTL